MATTKLDFKKINVNDIIEWCKANGQVAWLKEQIATPYYTKDGAERKITFVELKMAFVRKFMPEIAPVAKPKAPSMFELIEAL